MSEPETYDFHLIFRGLFRCLPSDDETKLDVFLVDARSPKASETTGEPLRDHRAAIEFRLGDWLPSNRRPIENLVEINKPKKGPVGLYLLDGQDIDIKPTSGEISPPINFASSFRKLPNLNEFELGTGTVRPEAIESGDGCIARILDLFWGEVHSERESTLGGDALMWAFSRPRSHVDLGSLDSEDRQLLRDAARTINLDVRVKMKVPKDADVIIDLAPFSGEAVDETPFILHPAEGRPKLEVWIKNRELHVILTESDELDSEDGPLEENVDFDFELHYNLSSNPKNRLIPYRTGFFSEEEEGEEEEGEDVSNGGCACGGCTGGSGG